MSIIKYNMKTFSVLKYYRNFLKNVLYRSYTSNLTKENSKVENIRNIGILAHIDAGKTTTTERMLFYSGTIRSMGEVHHGNTVTDYMEQERQRGITITSAAVSFPWREHQINLIDTPGHIDFTMEVEQSLAVLDGAVIVLDASAGVEAQTLTVWRQANGHKIPRILYLNKMDRSDADVDTCIRSVQEKLHAEPLLLQLPIYFEKKLIGLIDLVTLEEVMWHQGRGQNYIRRKLSVKDGQKWEDSMKYHTQLIDSLSSVDDQLAEKIIREESLENMDIKEIELALRRSTVNMKVFPVLCGSSYKNVGVQTLMDAVITYLPSPLDINTIYKCFQTDLSARAFKVQHDDQRGVLTFLRLYSGEISKGARIYNLARDTSEQTGFLYLALADEYQPVDRVTAGNIAVVSSLKVTMTGDLVTSSQAAAARAKNKLADLAKDGRQVEGLITERARQRLESLGDETKPEDVADMLLGIGTHIPEPVFLRSVEPPSVGYQTALETALEELTREDPSLRIIHDDDMQQMLLAGMGELHLEIIKERIIREYKIDVELGPPQISYREMLVGTSKQTLAVERTIGNSKHSVKVMMSARTVGGVGQDQILRFDKSGDSASNLANIHPRYQAAIRSGVTSALVHGPKLGCPLVNIQVMLHWFEAGRGTSDSVVTATVVQCLRKVFEESDSILLEPIMSLQLVVPESHSSQVLADLSRRRAEIQRINVRHTNKVVECIAPMAELLGYSSDVRLLSSGLATFSMEFHTYQQMTPYDEAQAIKNITGI